MAKIHVDGKSYEVEVGNNLLHACLSLGLDLPYFCWHPALGSVGSCRQCAVKQFKDEPLGLRRFENLEAISSEVPVGAAFIQVSKLRLSIDGRAERGEAS